MKKLWQALMLVRRCDRGSFWRRVVYVVLQSLLPLVNLYILKMMVDSVEQAVRLGGVSSLPVSPVTLLLAMVGIFLLNRVVSALNNVNNDVLSQRLLDYMSDIMQRQAARLDMAYFDTPSFYDSMHRAQQESSYRPLQIMNNFMSFFGSVLSIAGVVALLSSASPWVIAVMVVAVLPGFAVRLYKARLVYDFRRDNTQLYRRTAYYGTVLSARDYAKEMRAYRLTDFFRGRFVDNRKSLVGRLLRISRRMGTVDVMCSVVEAAAMFGVVWLLMSQAFSAAITIGSFVMLFEAFRRGQGYLTALVSSIAALYDNRLFVGNLFEFLELEPGISSPAEPVPVPQTIDTIEFRDITFRYPDMYHDVLCHFNLMAKRGEITRIEGRNGYGKSTLIKLLLRFYDPQEGQVLINGIDIRRFGLDDLRRHIGVVFQDFVRFQCTIRENVEFGGGVSDSGLLDFVDSLPQGKDTLLGRVFDGGSELSMGQWQRVAIERSLASDAPILLLDEPTAWLDNNSRRLLDDTLHSVVKEKIIIMISHI